jgi:hypothetical protein
VRWPTAQRARRGRGIRARCRLARAAVPRHPPGWAAAPGRIARRESSRERDAFSRSGRIGGDTFMIIDARFQPSGGAVYTVRGGIGPADVQRLAVVVDELTPDRTVTLDFSAARPLDRATVATLAREVAPRGARVAVAGLPEREGTWLRRVAYAFARRGRRGAGSGRAAPRPLALPGAAT